MRVQTHHHSPPATMMTTARDPIRFKEDVVPNDKPDEARDPPHSHTRARARLSISKRLLSASHKASSPPPSTPSFSSSYVAPTRNLIPLCPSPRPKPTPKPKSKSCLSRSMNASSSTMPTSRVADLKLLDFPSPFSTFAINLTSSDLEIDHPTTPPPNLQFQSASFPISPLLCSPPRSAEPPHTCHSICSHDPHVAPPLKRPLLHSRHNNGEARCEQEAPHDHKKYDAQADRERGVVGEKDEEGEDDLGTAVSDLNPTSDSPPVPVLPCHKPLSPSQTHPVTIKTFKPRPTLQRSIPPLSHLSPLSVRPQPLRDGTHGVGDLSTPSAQFTTHLCLSQAASRSSSSSSLSDAIPLHPRRSSIPVSNVFYDSLYLVKSHSSHTCASPPFLHLDQHNQSCWTRIPDQRSLPSSSHLRISGETNRERPNLSGGAFRGAFNSPSSLSSSSPHLSKAPDLGRTYKTSSATPHLQIPVKGAPALRRSISESISPSKLPSKTRVQEETNLRRLARSQTIRSDQEYQSISSNLTSKSPNRTSIVGNRPLYGQRGRGSQTNLPQQPSHKQNDPSSRLSIFSAQSSVRMPRKTSLNRLLHKTDDSTRSVKSHDHSPVLHTASSDACKPNTVTFEKDEEKLIERIRVRDGDQEVDEGEVHYLQRLALSVEKSRIGSLLATSSSPFHLSALKVYMNSFEFSHDPIDLSLRKLLMGVYLPKESQQIDRLMEAFASRYVSCNPRLFRSSEQVYVLAFSIIMLHTDAFNKNNRAKMSRSDYVKNTSMDGVPHEVLEYIYDNVTYTEFIFVNDEASNRREEPHKTIVTPAKPAANAQDTSAHSCNNLSTPILKSGITTGKLDPYQLIARGLTHELRPNIESMIPSRNPYSFTGSTPYFDSNQLRQSFGVDWVTFQIVNPLPQKSNSTLKQLAEEVLVKDEDEDNYDAHLEDSKNSGSANESYCQNQRGLFPWLPSRPRSRKSSIEPAPSIVRSGLMSSCSSQNAPEGRKKSYDEEKRQALSESSPGAEEGGETWRDPSMVSVKAINVGLVYKKDESIQLNGLFEHHYSGSTSSLPTSTSKSFNQLKMSNVVNSSKYKWRPWCLLLTAGQLLLMKDARLVSELKSSIKQAQTENRSDQSPSQWEDQLVVRITGLKPDLIVDLTNSIALFDSSMSQGVHAFRLVLNTEANFLLRVDREDELNYWITHINYAATHRSSRLSYMIPYPPIVVDNPRQPYTSSVRGARRFAVEMIEGGAEKRMGEGGLMSSPSLTTSSPFMHSGQKGSVAASSSPGRRDLTRFAGRAPSERNSTGRVYKTEFDCLDWANRVEVLKRKIVVVEDLITQWKTGLNEDLRLARNVAVLAPFQASTRTRLQQSIIPISERARSLRIGLSRWVCYREVLTGEANLIKEHFLAGVGTASASLFNLVNPHPHHQPGQHGKPLALPIQGLNVGRGSSACDQSDPEIQLSTSSSDMMHSFTTHPNARPLGQGGRKSHRHRESWAGPFSLKLWSEDVTSRVSSRESRAKNASRRLSLTAIEGLRSSKITEQITERGHRIVDTRNVKPMPQIIRQSEASSACGGTFGHVHQKRLDHHPPQPFNVTKSVGNAIGREGFEHQACHPRTKHGSHVDIYHSSPLMLSEVGLVCPEDEAVSIATTVEKVENPDLPPVNNAGCRVAARCQKEQCQHSSKGKPQEKGLVHRFRRSNSCKFLSTRLQNPVPVTIGTVATLSQPTESTKRKSRLTVSALRPSPSHSSTSSCLLSLTTPPDGYVSHRPQEHHLRQPKSPLSLHSNQSDVSIRKRFTQAWGLP